MPEAPTDGSHSDDKSAHSGLGTRSILCGLAFLHTKGLSDSHPSCSCPSPALLPRELKAVNILSLTLGFGILKLECFLNSYSMRGGAEDVLALGMYFYIMSSFLPLVQIKDFIKKKKLIQHVVFVYTFISFKVIGSG